MHSSNSFAKNLNGHISHVTFTKSLPILDEALYKFVTFCTVICRIWLVGLWKSLYIFRHAWSVNRVTEGRLNLGQIYVTWRFKTKSQWITITVKILVPHINSVTTHTTRVWNKHNWDNTILWKFTKHARKMELSDYINCFSTFLVTICSHSFCSCLLQCQIQVALLDYTLLSGEYSQIMQLAEGKQWWWLNSKSTPRKYGIVHCIVYYRKGHEWRVWIRGAKTALKFSA